MPTTYAISAITNASPAEITSAANPFSTGQIVQILGVAGMTGFPFTGPIIVLSSTQFTIPLNTTSSGAYPGSGGYAEVLSQLPALKSGYVAKYPLTIEQNFSTGVFRALNDSEQRWARRQPVFGFQLVYTDVDSYDVNIMREFFLSKKGMFVDGQLTNTFTVVLPDDILGTFTTYNFCYFYTEDFTTVESKPNLYSFVLKLGQARHN